MLTALNHQQPPAKTSFLLPSPVDGMWKANHFPSSVKGRKDKNGNTYIHAHMEVLWGGDGLVANDSSKHPQVGRCSKAVLSLLIGQSKITQHHTIQKKLLTCSGF